MKLYKIYQVYKNGGAFGPTYCGSFASRAEANEYMGYAHKERDHGGIFHTMEERIVSFDDLCYALEATPSEARLKAFEYQKDLLKAGSK